jgi:hypothetical protein
VSDIAMTTVVYPKHRYACRLGRVKPERVDRETRRPVDEARVVGVMTRWLRRCGRDEPVVLGTARVEVMEDLPTGRYGIEAVAPAFKDVAPEDRELLERWVDRPDFQAVQVPRFAPIDVRVKR